jgi:hypothetical protein
MGHALLCIYCTILHRHLAGELEEWCLCRTSRLPDSLIIQERFTMNDRNISGEQRTESNTTETECQDPLNHGYEGSMPQNPPHHQDSSWFFPNIYKWACNCEFSNTLSLLISSLSFDHFQSSASNQSERWLGTLKNPKGIRKWVTGNPGEYVIYWIWPL